MNTCMYTNINMDRYRAQLAVPVIVPCILIVFAALYLISATRQEPVSDVYGQETQVGTGGTVLSMQNRSSTPAPGAPNAPVDVKNAPPMYNNYNSPNANQGQADHHHQQWTPGSDQGQVRLMAYQNTQPQSQPAGYTPQQQWSSTEGSAQPFLTPGTGLPTTTTTSAAHFQRERLVVIICLAAYFFLMLPNTCFSMVVTYDSYANLDIVAWVALKDGFFYLSLIRALILPTVWFSYPN